MRKINEDTSNTWAWIGLTITLIGLIPVLGSLAKGCFKVLVASSRKATLRVAKNTVDTDLWKHTAYWVDAGIGKLAGLKKLKTLEVSQTPVTDPATDEWKAAIPGLAIVRK